MHTVGEAKTKLILFGEHSAVYNYPAVGLGLPWKIEVLLTPTDTMRWNLAYLKEPHEKLERLLKLLPELFVEFSHCSPVEITAKADAPIGVGLGSSGALCVALTRAVMHYLELKAGYHTEEERQHAVWNYAHELEKVFHQTPSGIDTGLSTYGGLCTFEWETGELPACVPVKDVELHLVIGALPRESDTGALVSDLKKQIEKYPEFAVMIQELGSIAEKSIRFLRSPNSQLTQELGQLAGEAQHYLSALGLSTSSLDYLLKWGRSLGASGGKLSGAGGGGAYFLIAESRAHAEEMAMELQQLAGRNEIHHVVTPQAFTHI